MLLDSSLILNFFSNYIDPVSGFPHTDSNTIALVLTSNYAFHEVIMVSQYQPDMVIDDFYLGFSFAFILPYRGGGEEPGRERYRVKEREKDKER